MTGYISKEQLEAWKKAEVIALAKDMGVSTEGTKAEIIERICAEEVEVPDEAEASVEPAPAAEETQENDGMENVRCIKRFKDLKTDVMRTVGDEWETDAERAKMLVQRKLVELI